MQSMFNNSASKEFLPNHWLNWCRLCAKDDRLQNIHYLDQNHDSLDNESNKLTIQQAILKYFCIQTSLEDSLPKMLCINCLSLISSIINFNEHVKRVQIMFSYLSDIQRSTNNLDLEAVRIKFDVLESETDNLLNKYSLSEVEKKYNNLTNNGLGKGCLNNGELNVQIKLESVDKQMSQDYNKFLDDVHQEKEEMIFGDNISDSFPEVEEDPFQHNDRKQQSSSDEEQENPTLTPSFEMKFDMAKSKLERIKKKRRRKKLKLPATDFKKKESSNKDFKMESTCKECGVKFAKYILYREHMQQEHNQFCNEKHWPCPACDKVLLSLCNLERHVRIHLPMEVRQTIKCSECDNRYVSNAQLETHIRYKHKNEKPFICEECGLRLRTNSNLRQHMLIHTDISPFECEVCKKKFKNKTRLKTHMDIHSPNKHVCNICGLQLNSRATLNRHFLVHSDEMQHKCDYCGKAFKRAKALKNHLLLHTGLKPYSCDFCERTFANGSNCRSHMKKIHPGELAILEASGNKTHTKNIPKLATLKAVTKGADNLTPVVTKFSGCFAFGKKPKHLNSSDTKLPLKLQSRAEKNYIKHSSVSTSPSSPLDLQCTPLVDNTTISTFIPDSKNLENVSTTSTITATAPIPNFDNIYQHLLKQNQTDFQIKQPLSQISPPQQAVSTPHHDPFHQDIITQNVKPSSHLADDLLDGTESHQSSMTPLTAHDDRSSASLIPGTFYGSISTLTPRNFI